MPFGTLRPFLSIKTDGTDVEVYTTLPLPSEYNGNNILALHALPGLERTVAFSWADPITNGIETEGIIMKCSDSTEGALTLDKDEENSPLLDFPDIEWNPLVRNLSWQVIPKDLETPLS